MNLAIKRELLTAFSGEVYRGMDGRIGAIWFTPKLNVVVHVHLTGERESPTCITHLDNTRDYLEAKQAFMAEVAPFVERVYPNLQIFSNREIKTANNENKWSFVLQHQENLIISITSIFPNTLFKK